MELTTLKTTIPTALQISLEKVLTSNCNLGAKKDLVEKIIIGKEHPVRKFEKKEIAQPLFVVISACAKLYCGMNEQKGAALETIQESCRFVIDRYGWISIHEIELAFKLAASNVFDNVEMKAYGGIFTIAMLGDILTAYQKYRNKIIQNFDNELSKITAEQNQKEIERKNNAARLQIKTDIKNAIKMKNEGGSFWETWKDVPVHYAKIALDNSFISVSHEFKKMVFEKAQALAKGQLIEKSQDLRNPFQAKNAKHILMNHVEKAIDNELSHRIYAKLLIFEYVEQKALI
jgi:hypothetical protein